MMADSESNTLVTVTEVAEQVGREILESRLEPGAWATALYECGGRRQDAIAMYARLRVRKLTKQRRIRLAKVRSFESRRLMTCMGDQATRELLAKTIQEMLHSSKRGQPLNFMKPKLSVLWLFILFLGTAGTVAALGRLYSSYIPGALTHHPAMPAILAGVATVWGVLMLRYLLPKRWIMLCWNTGMVVACNIVCLCSLFLGTKVIKQSVASGVVVLPTRQSPAKLVKPAIKVKGQNKDNPYLVTTGVRNGSLEN